MAWGAGSQLTLTMAKCFDAISRELLLRMPKGHARDRELIALVIRRLKSGMMKDGLASPAELGVPQGGPLSALLSGIYMDKFDKLPEERGLKFVIYADDCNIYVKTKRAAERAAKSVTSFLEGELKLKVNQEKSQVGSPLRLKFHGFSLYKVKGASGIRIHGKSRCGSKTK